MASAGAALAPEKAVAAAEAASAGAGAAQAAEAAGADLPAGLRRKSGIYQPICAKGRWVFVLLFTICGFFASPVYIIYYLNSSCQSRQYSSFPALLVAQLVVL